MSWKEIIAQQMGQHMPAANFRPSVEDFNKPRTTPQSLLGNPQAPINVEVNVGDDKDRQQEILQDKVRDIAIHPRSGRNLLREQKNLPLAQPFYDYRGVPNVGYAGKRRVDEIYDLVPDIKAVNEAESSFVFEEDETDVIESAYLPVETTLGFDHPRKLRNGYPDIPKRHKQSATESWGPSIDRAEAVEEEGDGPYVDPKYPNVSYTPPDYDESDRAPVVEPKPDVVGEPAMHEPGARAVGKAKPAGVQRPRAPGDKPLGDYVYEQSTKWGAPWEDILFEMYSEKNPFYSKGALRAAIGKISQAHYDDFKRRNGTTKGYNKHLFESLNSSSFSGVVKSKKKKGKTPSKFSQAYNDNTSSNLIDVLKTAQRMTAKQMNDDWKNLGLSAGKISETGEIILNEKSAQEMRDKGAMIHNKSVAIANQLIPSILGANPTLNMGELSTGKPKEYSKVRDGLEQRLTKVYQEEMKTDKALRKLVIKAGGPREYARQIIIGLGLWSVVNTRTKKSGGKR